MYHSIALLPFTKIKYTIEIYWIPEQNVPFFSSVKKQVKH